MANAADTDARKRAAAEAAAELVEDGMRLGLGTGTTVAHLLPALADRRLRDLRCVATSPETERAASELGLAVEPFDVLSELDLAIDGADQIAPDGWLVKGGGGAHVREKVVAAAAARFVVIADDGKRVQRLGPPVPVELLGFGLEATLAALAALGPGGRARLRPGTAASPDGNLIADVEVPFDDPAELAARLDGIPGVVGHGLFAPSLVTELVVARADEVERSIIG